MQIPSLELMIEAAEPSDGKQNGACTEYQTQGGTITGAVNCGIRPKVSAFQGGEKTAWTMILLKGGLRRHGLFFPVWNMD